MIFGSIEAGGTKFVCATGTADGTVIAQTRIPTTTPEETIPQVIAFFNANPVSAIGIGTFGPADIDPDSSRYGYITSTPKPGWRDYDFLGTMQAAIDVPYAFTTDVNEAGYAEWKAGAGKGHKNVLYWTVGTGIGAGYIHDGKLLQGYSNPEMGHIFLQRDPSDTYQGRCPFHGNQCLEGLAAGPAVEERAGKKGTELKPDDPAWELEAGYLAQACLDAAMILSPDIIIFGGGIMHQEQLLPMIRKKFRDYVQGYIDTPPLDDYIVRIGLNDEAGVMGGLLLAADAYAAK
ncbi:MAG: ROK family protein [Lactobacillus sp.]|jgi:fructokinase|nr:ROK family protein [Lactobacillus sp.]MCI1918085.1 ROK family protein [Lactobacillus sp.]MCI1941704.1 ROK family protein [Lactobacillus sp.]MCI1972250.1 ROK family protein [Lactobacillus sp.]MCI2016880.1 ROK family protein [Lactobacillus sp.]